MEAQDLHAAKNGYCPLTQCTVHIKKFDREESNYHSLKAQRPSIDKTPSKSYRHYIINSELQQTWFILYSFPVQAAVQSPDAL